MKRNLSLLSIVFALTSLVVAKKVSAQVIPESEPSEDTAVDASEPQPKVELLYWDNKNLGFGHVALSITGMQSEPASLYISYAMGNDYDVDREKHGKDPVRLELPAPTEEQLASFLAWYEFSPYVDVYSSSYGADYNILKHNCAHAILNALRALSYDMPIKHEAPLALRPWQVFRAARQLSAPNFAP